MKLRDAFDNIPLEDRVSLLTWYNRSFTATSCIDNGKESSVKFDTVSYELLVEQEGIEMVKTLISLYRSGKFKHWNCPECNDDVRIVRGDYNRRLFQCVSEADYTSYTGSQLFEKYRKKYISRLCDSCRCNLKA